MNHLNREEIQRYADGELDDAAAIAERPMAWLAAAAVVAFVVVGLLAAAAVGTLTSAGTASRA